MKKMMVLFGLLIFLCTAALNGLAEPIDGPKTALDGLARRYVTLGDERAYVLGDDGTLWTWDYAGEPEASCLLPIYSLEQGYYDTVGEELQRLEEAVFELAASDGALYAINAYSGRIGTVDGDGVRWAVDFDSSGLIAPYGWIYHFADMAIRDGALYILADRFELGVQVFRIDLTSGAASIFDAPDAIRMCVQGDHLLLVCLRWDEAAMDGEGMYLEAMDPATGKLSRLPQRIPAEEDWSIGLAASEEDVYLLSNGVFYVSRGGAEFEALQNGPDYVGEMRALPQGGIAYTGMGITLCPLAEEAASEKLVVRGDLFMSDIREGFKARHPEAVLQILDGMLTPAEAAERIRTGDTETDVFLMRVDAAFGALIDKGYAAPLDDDPIIAASAEKMFPAIRSALTNGQGRLAAYPAEVEAPGWGVNWELWQKHFGDKPLPSTYRELFEDLQAFLELEDDDGDLFFDYYDYPTMVQYVMKAHLAAQGDDARFDDPALRETLMLLERLQQTLRERRMESWDEMDMFYEEVGGLHSLVWHDMAYSTSHWALGGNSRRFMLSLDGELRAQGLMYAMIVNPLSTHQELARAFIALSASPDMETTRYAILHTDGQPVMHTYPSGEEEWRVSPDALEAWARVAENLRFGERTLLLGDRMDEQIGTLITRYVAGQLSLDQMLEQLDDVASMILREQQ